MEAIANWFIHNRRRVLLWFQHRPSHRRIVANTAWVILEYIVRLGIGLAVSILVARYLGPYDFGVLSYSLSIVAFLSTFVSLGLNGIVVRDIIKCPNEAGLLMGSSFALRVVGAAVSYVLIIAIALNRYASKTEVWVLLVVGASLVFRPVDTIDFWFQSKTQSKYGVLGKGSAFLLAAGVNIVLVLAGASLVAFAMAGLLESVLAAVLLVAIYAYKGQTIRSWSVHLRKMAALLRQSWILILSSFLALMNLKVDQIMLRWIAGPNEVGVYSVAVRFSEVWYFIPAAIVISIFPKLVEIRRKDRDEYKRRLQQGFDVLLTFSLPIAVVMTFVGTPVIRYLYGTQYERAGGILAIHVWAGGFIFMRALFSKWIIMENLLMLSVLSHGAGAIVNIALNLLLIDRYGGYGAAVATLFSYATASYLVLFGAPKTWPIARMMTKSMLFPARLLLYRDRVWA